MKLRKLLIMLLVILVITSAVISPTLARYSSTQEASGTFVAATLITESSSSNVVSLANISISDISPVSSSTVSFNVVDVLTVGSNKVICTMNQTYTLKIQATCNIPLFFQLKCDIDGDGTYEKTVDLGYNLTEDTSDNNNVVVLTHSEVMEATETGSEHKYQLVVSWGDETKTSEDYSGVLEYVSIEINSVQNPQ